MSSIRHQQNQHQQQNNRVNHTGHGRAAAVFNIRRRAGNRASGRDTAEKGGAGIAYALRHQLHIGVVASANHFISHHGGKQRFNSRQHGNGESVWQHGRHRFIGEIRHGKMRQRAGDTI